MNRKSNESEIIKCTECLYKKKCPRIAEFTVNNREPRQFRMAGCEFGHKAETVNQITSSDDS